MITLDQWHEAATAAPLEEIARVAGVHRTTAARWRITGRVPRAVTALLKYHFHGSLPPCAGPAWSGWRFGHDGLLYAPDLAQGFDPNEIRCLVWFRQVESWRDARARLAVREPA